MARTSSPCGVPRDVAKPDGGNLRTVAPREVQRDRWRARLAWHMTKDWERPTGRSRDRVVRRMLPSWTSTRWGVGSEVGRPEAHAESRDVRIGPGPEDDDARFGARDDSEVGWYRGSNSRRGVTVAVFTDAVRNGGWQRWRLVRFAQERIERLPHRAADGVTPGWKAVCRRGRGTAGPEC